MGAGAYLKSRGVRWRQEPQSAPGSQADLQGGLHAQTGLIGVRVYHWRDGTA